MKVEKILERTWVGVAVVVALAAVALGYRYARYDALVYMGGDSHSYFDAFQVLCSGQLDVYRTPVYPLVVGAFDSLFGPIQFQSDMIFERHTVAGTGDYIFYIVLLQDIVLVLALCCFLKMMRGLMRSGTCALALTVALELVLLLTARITSIDTVETECFALSWLIFYLYCLWRWVDAHSWRWGLAACVWSLLLLFLRPSLFFVTLMTLVVAAAMVWRRSSRGHWLTLACTVASLLLMVAYCLQIKAQTGLFTPSVVSVINRYLDLKISGILDGLQLTDATQQQLLDLSTADKAQYIIRGGGAAAFSDLVNSVIATHPNEYLRWTLHKLAAPRLWLEPALCLLVVIAAVKRRKRLSRRDYLALIIAAMAMMHWGITWLGAPNQWARLLVANVPMLAMLVGYLLDYFLNGLRKRSRLTT